MRYTKNLRKQVYILLLFRIITLCDTQKCVLHAKCIGGFWVSRFDINEAVVAAANSHFNSSDLSKFAKMWMKRRERWDKCIASCGRYFEKECITE